MFHILRRIHNFCVEHLIYPLTLSSLLACAVFVGRVYFSRSLTFNFLVWNLLLAWMPYLFSMLITVMHRRLPQSWWLLLIPGLLWLVFLPNAPYIITDWLHLDERPRIPIWYDIGMLALFAWTGCFLGVASLNEMHHVVRDYWSRFVSWLFVLGAIGLSGVGVYVGRFLRWNSWDLITDPHSIALDIAAQFAHPIRNASTFGFSFLFAAFLLVCYLMFVSIEHRQTERID
jgi:uncharacterized membrane protein